jgi:hypothetical protein
MQRRKDAIDPLQELADAALIVIFRPCFPLQSAKLPD